jgi:hypothetical protein
MALKKKAVKLFHLHSLYCFSKEECHKKLFCVFHFFSALGCAVFSGGFSKTFAFAAILAFARIGCGLASRVAFTRVYAAAFNGAFARRWLVISQCKTS